MKRSLSLLCATVLGAGLLVAIGFATAASAAAAPGPIASRTSSDYNSDALPTTQIDGVAWTQKILGNTVYVGGSFANARPAGVAAGGAGSVARADLMSYTLSTGVMTSWAPIADGAVLTSALSPDGSRLYVAGSFTHINGVSTPYIAEFNTATGALVTTFKAKTDGTVKAIAVTNTTVYVGGSFVNAGGVSRSRIAAFDAVTGAVLPWNPGADVTVWSMTMNPDKSLLIVGGAFAQIANHSAMGLAALDPATGAWVNWAATASISDWGQGNAGAGTGAAIYSLSADSTNVYGTGYNYYGYGNLEGAFSADGLSGTVNWVEDCHGDTYGVFAGSDAVYTVSHDHYCGNIGGFPQTSPTWTFHHALAYTKAATGTINHDPYGYNDWYGTPSPSLINWFPDFTVGNVTGNSQAAYSITGNSQYLAVAGEFPKVNNTAQQGLVRFASPSTQGDKDGPRVGGSTWPISVRALANSSARVSWPANWDRDDQSLTYQVLRGNTVVSTTTATSQFWNLPQMSFIDNGLTPGATYTYRVKAIDPAGNYAGSTYVTVTMPTNLTLSQYAKDVYGDGAQNYWRLDETSGSTVTDFAGSSDMALNGGYTQGVPGAIGNDNDTADTFDGNDGSFAATGGSPIVAPNTFSEEAWFKTTTTTGGKIVGFGDKNTGNSSNYDRHVFMNPNGTVTFGVYNNGAYTITTPNALNNGVWHYMVATLSPNGMVFYVDGKRVGTNTGTTVGQSYSGYWRVGGDSSWSGSNYFAGSIDDVGVYPSALSLTQVRSHFTDAGGSVNVTPAPTDAYGKTIYNDQPDDFYRLDEGAGPNAVDASGNGNTGVYSGGETFGVASPVAGSGDMAVTFNGSDGSLASAGPIAGPSVYTEEAWFNTTSNSGGKLLGFGDQSSGNSGSYDRHVYMSPNGTLNFGTYTGATNVLTSANSYNDGSWHYVVATQGSDGMHLYVDGALVASGSQTGQQPFSGYWRVGGDNLGGWPGAGNAFFSGTIDEAAFYPTELSPTQVAAHFNAASAVNHAPTASFTTANSGLTASVDGTGSSDADGSITTYAWDFGDGHTATGATASNAYAAGGTYTITLTVTDNGGLSNTSTQQVNVTAPPANQPPVAAFSSTLSNLTASFDGSGSADPDGTVATFAWDFGDGGTGTGAKVNHVYKTAGTYTATLTVIDDKGATNSVSHPVVTNQPPAASFTSTVNNLAVAFDGAGSADLDGNVASYAWDFGDGNTGTGATPSHTYKAVGTYTVRLTVTDDQGATGTVSHNVATTASPNQPPTAAFTATANGLTASFNGSTSSDSDGTVSSYAWDFGDGSTGTGATPTHVYASAGTYTVALSVTDNAGATNSVSRSLAVTSVNIVAADAFERSATAGWGSADTGGAWTRSGGAASDESVNGHMGQMTMTATGKTTAMYLNGVSQRDESGSYDFSLSAAPTGSGVLSWVALRHTSGGDYRVRVLASPTYVQLLITKILGTTETTLATQKITGMTVGAGDILRVAFEVSGASPTTVKAKVWKLASTEPAGWQLTTTDSSAQLQTAGSIGILGYLGNAAGTVAPVTMSVDNLSIIAD